MASLSDWLTVQRTLPASGTLVGRIWDPAVAGPSLVRVEGGDLVDISATYPTMRDLCEAKDPAAAARASVNVPSALLRIASKPLFTSISGTCL